MTQSACINWVRCIYFDTQWTYRWRHIGLVQIKTDQETWILISLNTKYSIFAASIVTYNNHRATYYSFLDTVTLIVQFSNFPFWKTSLKARDWSCFSVVEHETALTLGPRIFETLNTFSSVGFLYWNNALEWCPDLLRINFSSTPPVNREETQVIRKLWAVLH